MKKFLFVIFFLNFTATANAGHKHGSSHTEWGVGINPMGGITFGIGSRGSGAGNVWVGPNYYIPGYNYYPYPPQPYPPPQICQQRRLVPITRVWYGRIYTEYVEEWVTVPCY